VLGCAAMMGLMMLMMRGNHSGHHAVQPQPDPHTQEEIAMLRAELATLRAEQDRANDSVERAGRD